MNSSAGDLEPGLQLLSGIVTPMMVLVSRIGWVGDVFEGPVFIISSMLLISSPAALTLAQISQRVKPTVAARAATNPDTFSAFERLLSWTVFWAYYLILTPLITIASVMVVYRVAKRGKAIKGIGDRYRDEHCDKLTTNGSNRMEAPRGYTRSHEEQVKDQRIRVHDDSFPFPVIALFAFIFALVIYFMAYGDSYLQLAAP
ncbi:hypothetical protein HD554DRAFT_2327756 [Boletus coccyginus]|nr:hypothetical protein HD554DRAFT_2327756 [Boletus coccyginus]